MTQTLPKRYSAASIALHWPMLALIVAVYVCMDIHDFFPKGSATREGLKTWHYMLGLSVFAVVWLRLLARVGTTTPPVEPALVHWQEHAAAALFHHYFQRDNTLRRMLLQRR